MGRSTWNMIKASKFFYIRTYRALITCVLISAGLNVLLCIAVIYAFRHQPATTFYATSGETPPIELKAMNSPNNTSEALLPPDPVDESDIRLIPE